MRAVDAEHDWLAARFERRGGWDEFAYPFDLPVVRNRDELTFHPKVTHSPIIAGYPDALISQAMSTGLEAIRTRH